MSSRTALIQLLLAAIFLLSQRVLWGAVVNPETGAVTLQSNSINLIAAPNMTPLFNNSANSLGVHPEPSLSTGNSVTAYRIDKVLSGANATVLKVAQPNSTNFYSTSGTGYFGTVSFAPDLDGEIIPTLVAIPEANTWLGGAFAFATLILMQRRRFLRPRKANRTSRPV